VRVPHPEPRTAEQRKADTLARLATPVLDGWVATAGPAGAHLVPLSLYWTGAHLAIAVDLASVTARNIAASGRARIGLGPTRDVVMIDATLDTAVPVADAPADLADGYAGQSDWDPRESPDGYAYLVLTPQRILAWREVNEIAGRTLMRGGAWLV
jgi:hypothetical protein